MSPHGTLLTLVAQSVAAAVERFDDFWKRILASAPLRHLHKKAGRLAARF
jgi:hypothetical protein